MSLDWSIIGPVRLSPSATGLRIRDSIVDGAGGAAIAGLDSGYGPATIVERTTVLGSVKVDEITEASDSLFADRVIARRTIDGAIRASFVPWGSRTPRRERCQPDLAIEGADELGRARILQWLKPSFTSIHFGDPGYAQLSRVCPGEITGGSARASEMGVFHHLHQSDREARLRAALEEYLPYALRSRVIYVT